MPLPDDDRDAAAALEAAREALYRPDADDRTLRRFEELFERDAEDQAAASARARSQGVAAPFGSARRRAPRRRAVVLGSLAVAVVIGVVVAIGALRAPDAVAVTMRPLRMVSTTTASSSEEAAVLSLFAGSFAAENQLALRTVIDRPPALAHGGVQRVAVRRLDGSAVIPAPDPERTTNGSVTVLVLCTTASAYRWVLTGEDASDRGRERVLASSGATGCRGTAAYATVFLQGERVAALRVTARAGEQTLAAVVVVPTQP